MAPTDRRYGEALPKDTDPNGAPLPWTGNRKLFFKSGACVLFHEYLRMKVLEGMPVKPTKDFVSDLDISESEQWTFPFKIFVYSLFHLLTTNNVYHTHEQNFPISLWHVNYSKIRDLFLDLEADPELERLVQKPVFIHVGAANRNLIPVTAHGPGLSAWGVKLMGEPGYEEQQRFWSESPHSDGPHGWRVLAGANMFTETGTSAPEVMKKMLASAHDLYQLYSMG